MSLFLGAMLIGLVGLLLMALPGVGRHGHAGTHLGGSGGHGPGLGLTHLPHLPGAHPAPALHAGHLSPALPHGPAGAGAPPPESAPGSAITESSGGAPAGSALRLIPAPRAIFSILAVYGASGYLLLESLHLAFVFACLLALVPAVLFERLVLTPFWNLLLRFQGQPSRSLDELILSEAEATTPFRNGRGIVVVSREGRRVQFSASLIERQVSLPVEVGDRLLIESVDPMHEHVTVSIN